MARKVVILAALAGLALVPAAYAHGIASISVPEAAYQPGAEVVVRGQFVDPEITALAAPATVTLGIDGPVVGTAPIAADGSWTLTFTLPYDVALGTYVLAASVQNADGSLATPLLARAQIVVGTPAPVSTEAPAATSTRGDELAPLDSLRHGGAFFTDAAPVVAARAATPPADPTAPTVRAAVHTAAPAVTRPQARAAAAVAKVASAPHARPVATQPASAPRATTAAPALRANTAAPARPRTATPQPKAQPRAAAAPRANGVRPTATRTAKTHRGRLAFLLVAGLLLLLLGATGVWAVLRTRRRRALAAMEAELQALLAEEEARADDREPVSV